jgi:L-alanine-DL-glutamate epimerase-like enolase superfamily enzyme
MIAKLVVRVDTDAGLYGLGEADDFMGVRDGIAYLRQYLKGRDPMELQPIVSEALYGSLPPHGGSAKNGIMEGGIRAIPSMSPTATATGPVAWAISGVEMALCDVVGKALKTPVYNLLGGKFRDRVRVYLDRSSPQAVESLDAWRAIAAAGVEDGFSQMKFDIDYMATDVSHDVWNRSLSSAQLNRIVARLRAVREAVGPDIEISVDCHMHYTATDAIRLSNELASLRLLWLEDPCPILNPDSYVSVRAKSPIPICVGEMFIAEQFRTFIDHGACDIVHPDVMFSGGLRETRKIADYAELHHLPLAMHGNGGCLATIAAAHVAAASRNFIGLEYHFIETPWIGEFVKREGPLFDGGCVPLTDAPGLGVTLDAEICRKYLAAGETLLE